MAMDGALCAGASPEALMRAGSSLLEGQVLVRAMRLHEGFTSQFTASHRRQIYGEVKASDEMPPMAM